jgi:hypothetical protein
VGTRDWACCNRTGAERAGSLAHVYVGPGQLHMALLILLGAWTTIHGLLSCVCLQLCGALQLAGSLEALLAVPV